MRPVKLGMMLGAWFGANLKVPVERVKLAEELGYDSVWSSEAYGADALSPLAYLAAVTDRIKLATAVVQLGARTPANTAMAFATIEALAGEGRVIVGLGLSGPADRGGLVRHAVGEADRPHARHGRDHAPDLRARGAGRLRRRGDLAALPRARRHRRGQAAQVDPAHQPRHADLHRRRRARQRRAHRRGRRRLAADGAHAVERAHLPADPRSVARRDRDGRSTRSRSSPGAACASPTTSPA